MLRAHFDSIGLLPSKQMNASVGVATLSKQVVCTYFIVDVKDAFLDFLIDFFGRADERLFHVGSRLG